MKLFQGDGKRSGNGRCLCEKKYAGTNCSRCQEGYSKSIDGDNEVICSGLTTNFVYQITMSVFPSLVRYWWVSCKSASFALSSLPMQQYRRDVRVLRYVPLHLRQPTACVAHLGEPFYHQLPKVSSLAVVVLTASFLMYKDMYGLASIMCTLGSVLIVLYAKHLLWSMPVLKAWTTSRKKTREISHIGNHLELPVFVYTYGFIFLNFVCSRPSVLFFLISHLHGLKSDTDVFLFIHQSILW